MWRAWSPSFPVGHAVSIVGDTMRFAECKMAMPAAVHPWGFSTDDTAVPGAFGHVFSGLVTFGVGAACASITLTVSVPGLSPYDVLLRIDHGPRVGLKRPPPMATFHENSCDTLVAL